MSLSMKWRDILFLAPLSVCQSVCSSRFCVRSISFEPLVGFKNFFAQMSSMMSNVQCLCLTKVGSRSRSQSKIKHCMTVFRVRLISFELLVGFINDCTNVKYYETSAVAMFDQGRFKVKVTI